MIHGMKEEPSELTPAVSELEISSVTDLITALKSVRFAPAWFRGQGDSNWPLIPAAHRDETLKANEVNIFRRFRQETAALAPDRVITAWDWLTWAQHYSLPTRLMDWTLNPLVGLYFAVSETTHDGADGRLFCLDPVELNSQSRNDGREVLLLDDARNIDDYLPGSKVESRLAPIAVVSQKSFGRISSQSGVFTISSHNDSKGFSFHAKEALLSWVVPSSKKEVIRDELSTLRIEASTMMDSPDRFADSIRKEYGNDF